MTPPAAVIVLQGLFLLVCHIDTPGDSTSHYCKIYVPHTPMDGADAHLYKVGVGATSNFTTINWTDLPQQNDFSTTMSLGMPQAGQPKELTAATNDPFQKTYNDGFKYPSHQFLLDGNLLSVTSDPGLARNVISVPWPDLILGGNKVGASTSDVVKASDDRKYVYSLPQGNQFLFSETVVLAYNTGGTFFLRDETGFPVASSTTSGATAIMILSSWPPTPPPLSDHSFGFNTLLVGQKGKHPTFQVTGIANTSNAVEDDEFKKLGLSLPEGVLVALPPDKTGKERITTNNTTGCGVGSINNH